MLYIEQEFAPPYEQINCPVFIRVRGYTHLDMMDARTCSLIEGGIIRRIATFNREDNYLQVDNNSNLPEFFRILDHVNRVTAMLGLDEPGISGILKLQLHYPYSKMYRGETLYLIPLALISGGTSILYGLRITQVNGVLLMLPAEVMLKVDDRYIGWQITGKM